MSPEEKADIRNKRKQTQAANPFYLMAAEGSSSTPSNDPEVQRLDPANFGMTTGDLREALTTEKRKGRRHRRDQKQYTVNVEEEMPEGANPEHDPEEEHSGTGDSSDLGSVDLSNISPTETLPTLQHRTVSSPILSPKSPATEAARNPNMLMDPEAIKKEERRKRHEEKKKRREERRKGGHRRHKKGESKPEKEATPEKKSEPEKKSDDGGLLLNFGDVQTTPTHASQPTSTKELLSLGNLGAISSPPPTTSSALEEFLLSNTTHPTTQPSQISPSQIPSQQAPSVGGTSTEGDKKERRHRHRTGSRKEGEHRHRRHRHRTGSRKEEEPAKGDVNISLDKLRIRTLMHDEILNVTFELKLNPKETTKCLATFCFTNVSKEVVFTIGMDITTTLTTKYQRPPNSAASGPFETGITLTAGQSKSYNVMFIVQSLLLPIKLPGSLVYTHQSGQAAKKKPFQLVLPSSGFILPNEISRDEFVGLMRSGLTLSPTTISSTIKKALQYIQALFRVSIVEDQGTKASLYGRTIQGHHVAILMKESEQPGSVSLAVKCNDQQLSDSLAKELTEFFSTM